MRLPILLIAFGVVFGTTLGKCEPEPLASVVFKIDVPQPLDRGAAPKEWQMVRGYAL